MEHSRTPVFVAIDAGVGRLFCWRCGDFYFQSVAIDSEVSGEAPRFLRLRRARDEGLPPEFHGFGYWPLVSARLVDFAAHKNGSW
jgi:hypothetical protein